MPVEFKDYYQILGVERSASEKEIKRAFRKLAREFHPDVNPGSKPHEDRFKELNEAYEVLGDPEKRRRYDQLGANYAHGKNFTPPPGFEGFGGYGGQVDLGDILGQFGMGSGSGRGGFSDFFEMMFGAAQQGANPYGPSAASSRAPQSLDLESVLPVTLELVAAGGGMTVTHPETGKRLQVQIPKGIQQGAKIRLTGEGRTFHGHRGHWLLVIQYRPHALFELAGPKPNDLQVTLPVSMVDLALGCQKQVPTLSDAKIDVTIPPGSQPGSKLRLKGQGLPGSANKSRSAAKTPEAGDLYVRLKGTVPKVLTPEIKALLEALKPHLAP